MSWSLRAEFTRFTVWLLPPPVPVPGEGDGNRPPDLSQVMPLIDDDFSDPRTSHFPTFWDTSPGENGTSALRSRQECAGRAPRHVQMPSMPPWAGLVPVVAGPSSAYNTRYARPSLRRRCQLSNGQGRPPCFLIPPIPSGQPSALCCAPSARARIFPWLSSFPKRPSNKPATKRGPASPKATRMSGPLP